MPAPYASRYGGSVTDAISPSGRQFPISAAGQRAVVVEVGGGLREYGTADRPVLAGYPADVMQPHSAGAVLVPWPNRIGGGSYTFRDKTYQLGLTEPARGNAIHGLARWVRWQLVEHTDDAVELVCDLAPQTGYPFSLRASVRWSIGPDGLRADHHAQNLGRNPAPYGLGTHPYLHLGTTELPEAALRLPAATRLLLDERACPVGRESVAGGEYDFRAGRKLGELRLDTPFADLDRDDAGIATARVELAGGAATEVWMDEAFGYLQAYTVTGFSVGVDAVAVEPMTCAPDAFNSGDGLVKLAPGAEWSGSWGIRPV